MLVVLLESKENKVKRWDNDSWYEYPFLCLTLND